MTITNNRKVQKRAKPVFCFFKILRLLSFGDFCTRLCLLSIELFHLEPRTRKAEAFLSLSQRLRCFVFVFVRVDAPFHTPSKNMSDKDKNKKVLALITEGTEEMELVISVDVIRRAGVNVTVAGLGAGSVYKCSRGVLVSSDSTLDDALTKGPYDVILLPGGPGFKTFSASEKVGSILKDQEKSDRFIAAICAAPVVLKAHNICGGKKITCYPSVKDQMTEGGSYTYVDEKVVIDGKLVTSQGPGTAYEFALAVVEQLLGKDAATNVSKALLL